MIPCEHADRVIGGLAGPGEFQGVGRQFARGLLVMKGRERFPRLDLAGGNDLRHGKGAHSPWLFGGVDVTDRGVRCAQVKSDDISGGGGHGGGIGD